CPRCFWLDVRLKITRPNTPPFNINKTIDELLKKEFDEFRKAKKPHPLMTEYSVNAIPFEHDQLDTWRENFIGVTTVHEATNLHIFGAIDDVWVNSEDELMVVDYKATSKATEVSIDSDWQISYKRQLEVYQWLLRQNGFNVNNTGYFVYTNGRIDLDGFNDRVEFKTKIIPYLGDDSWVETTIVKMKQCMDADEMPQMGVDIMGGPCSYCSYSRSRTELTLKYINSKSRGFKK
ncbi:MAG: PD-(D/E)XK nuclease family protein, partial [Bdellovibrionales bacterium]